MIYAIIPSKVITYLHGQGDVIYVCIYSFFNRNSHLLSLTLNLSCPPTYLRSLLDLSSSILPKLCLPLLLKSSPPRVFPISLSPTVLLSNQLLTPLFASPLTCNHLPSSVHSTCFRFYSPLSLP